MIIAPGRPWQRRRAAPRVRRRTAAATSATSSTRTLTRTPPRQARSRSARRGTRRTSSAPADRQRGRQPGHRHARNGGGNAMIGRRKPPPGQRTRRSMTRASGAPSIEAPGRCRLRSSSSCCSSSARTWPTRRTCRSSASGTEIKATFENATTLRTTSPVRIAGVNVGEVTGVEAEGDNAEVTMTLKDEALPDPRGRDRDDPPPPLPGGQLLHRPEARHAVRRRVGLRRARSRSPRPRRRSRSTRSSPRSRATRAKA